MKSITAHILLFISSFIGASFSFWYLIDQHIYQPQLTGISSYAYFINHGLFILALVFMLYTFFMKPKLYKTIAIIVIFMGLSYLIIMFSFLKIRYLYLIPLAFYLGTGLIILYETKIRKS